MSKIYVVGIGPGAYDQMTGRAIRALNESDVIIGYTVYVDLVKEYFAGKEFMTTPMKKEVDKKRQDSFHDLQRRCRCLRYGRSDV